MGRNIGLRALFAGMLTIALAWPATAQLPAPVMPPPPLVEPVAQCRESSNGCEVCRVDLHGVKHCSLPGIACQPSGWRCIKSEVMRTDSVLPR